MHKISIQVHVYKPFSLYGVFFLFHFVFKSISGVSYVFHPFYQSISVNYGTTYMSLNTKCFHVVLSSTTCLSRSRVYAGLFAQTQRGSGTRNFLLLLDVQIFGSVLGF